MASEEAARATGAAPPTTGEGNSLMATDVMYETIWRAKGIVDGAETIDDMVNALRDAADELDAMKSAGVMLRDHVTDDYATLGTDDAEVAHRFGLMPEEEPDDDSATD